MNELFNVLWKGFFSSLISLLYYPYTNKFYDIIPNIFVDYKDIILFLALNSSIYMHIINWQILNQAAFTLHSPKWLKSPAVHLQNGLRDPFSNFSSLYLHPSIPPNISFTGIHQNQA